MTEVGEPRDCEAMAERPVIFRNPLTDPSWDTLASQHSESSFFHTNAWSQTLHIAYGYSPAYSAIEDAGRRSSVLPLMEVNSWITGKRGVSLPFTDECVVLNRNGDQSQLLFDSVLARGQERRWKYYEFRGGRSLFPEAPASVTFHGHTLKLECDERQAFARLNGTVRTAVRKAEQTGLTTEFGTDLRALKIFYRLFCQTRSKHGAPIQPFRFFEAVYTHILSRGLGFVVLAKLGSVPVAGAIFFHFERKAIYKFAASDESFKHLQGPSLVLWKAIERYIRGGFSQVDFGRTSLGNSGLRRFKLAWNPAERAIEYLKYSFRTRNFVVSSDLSIPTWRSRLFTQLPNPIRRLLGAVAYKHFG
jgi:hypothetical protein